MQETKTYMVRNKEDSNLCSGLYLVPTPIGNLRDMTLRALDILTHADVIVCEDSRVSGKLLASYGIKDKKKITYNDHADDAAKANILKLAHDNVIAVVSDAGTPLISDPGYKLCRDAIAAGIYVTALPGANAVLPALQLSGLPCDNFTFAGFLPNKDKAVRESISAIKNRCETHVFYESPKRIEKTCAILADVLGDRHIAVVREISKLYEESIRGAAAEILDAIKNKPLKGEIVIVIEGATHESNEDIDIDKMIEKALENGQSIKDLSTDLASVTGMKKKEIYNRALALQQ
jgi:16S rRNA (cytidine1402-2'-O)-methyltransferase